MSTKSRNKGQSATKSRIWTQKRDILISKGEIHYQWRYFELCALLYCIVLLVEFPLEWSSSKQQSQTWTSPFKLELHSHFNFLGDVGVSNSGLELEQAYLAHYSCLHLVVASLSQRSHVGHTLQVRNLRIIIIRIPAFVPLQEYGKDQLVHCGCMSMQTYIHDALIPAVQLSALVPQKEVLSLILGFSRRVPPKLV